MHTDQSVSCICAGKGWQTGALIMQTDLLDWEIFCLIIMNLTDQCLDDDERKAQLSWWGKNIIMYVDMKNIESFEDGFGGIISGDRPIQRLIYSSCPNTLNSRQMWLVISMLYFCGYSGIWNAQSAHALLYTNKSVCCYFLPHFASFR